MADSDDDEVELLPLEPEDAEEQNELTDDEMGYFVELFWDFFNDGAEDLAQDPVPDEEVAKLKEDWAKVKAELNKSAPVCTDAVTKKEKRGPLTNDVKKWAVKYFEACTSQTRFSDTQREFYIKTRGLHILHCRSQLDKWRHLPFEYGAGKVKRRTGPRVDKDPASVQLYQWFLVTREKGLPVSVAALKRKAEVILGAKPMKWWVQRWRVRYDVVLRMIQRRSAKPMEEIAEKLQTLHQYVGECRFNRVIKIFINFDEVPWSYSGSHSPGRTLEVCGAQNVFSTVDPNWDKRCASFIPVLAIICRASGWECLPLKAAVLLRRDCKKAWVLPNSHGWLVDESASGVVTSMFVGGKLLPFISAQVRSLLSEGEESMIIMDSASGHITEYARSVAKSEHNLAVIPGGLTQFSQPVDCGYCSLLRQTYTEECFMPWVHTKEPAGGSYAVAGRMLGWLAEAHAATLVKMDLPKVFSQLGWSSADAIKIPGFPTYNYIPEPPKTWPAAGTRTAAPNSMNVIDQMKRAAKRQREEREAVVQTQLGQPVDADEEEEWINVVDDEVPRTELCMSLCGDGCVGFCCEDGFYFGSTDDPHRWKPEDRDLYRAAQVDDTVKDLSKMDAITVRDAGKGQRYVEGSVWSGCLWLKRIDKTQENTILASAKDRQQRKRDERNPRKVSFFKPKAKETIETSVD
jgi:hypothetical protein